MTVSLSVIDWCETQAVVQGSALCLLNMTSVLHCNVQTNRAGVYGIVAHAARSCLFCGGREDLQSSCCPKDYHPTDGEEKNYTQQSKVTQVVALPEHAWMVYFSLSLSDRLLCLSSSRMAAAD